MQCCSRLAVSDPAKKMQSDKVMHCPCQRAGIENCVTASQDGRHRFPEQGRSTAGLFYNYASTHGTDRRARAALSEKLTSHEQACFLGSSGCFHQSNLSRCTHRMSYQAAADALCCSRFVLTCICRGMQTKQARNPAAALRL